MSDDAPKAFISHASADKDRFVLAFGAKLRELGVDAWLDEWEMHPGDSLVAKLFDEGIGTADAVVVVLSERSVDRPWVRQEIDAGFVRRVAGESVLIPVLLDLEHERVPEALRSIKWVETSVGAAGRAAEEVADALLDRSRRPPLRQRDRDPGLVWPISVSSLHPRQFPFREFGDEPEPAGIIRVAATLPMHTEVPPPLLGKTEREDLHSQLVISPLHRWLDDLARNADFADAGRWTRYGPNRSNIATECRRAPADPDRPIRAALRAVVSINSSPVTGRGVLLVADVELWPRRGREREHVSRTSAEDDEMVVRLDELGRMLDAQLELIDRLATLGFLSDLVPDPTSAARGPAGFVSGQIVLDLTPPVTELGSAPVRAQGEHFFAPAQLWPDSTGRRQQIVDWFYRLLLDNGVVLDQEDVVGWLNC